VRHDLCLYDDDDEMVAKMAPFLEEGLASGQLGVAVLVPAKRELLADSLGLAADRVTYIDPDAFYTRPQGALAGYDRKLRELVRDGANAIRATGELSRRCAGETELDSWVAYEAIINRAFAHHPLWLMCGYNKRELPEPLIEGALATHQEVLNGSWQHNSLYRPPERVIINRTPRPAELSTLQDVTVESTARAFRERLSAELRVARVPDSDVDDSVLAVWEVLTNAWRHRGERVGLKAGRVGDRFVCVVSDNGPGIDDPFAGFLPPHPGLNGGRGLWVARQLTAAMELVHAPGEFSVRLWADTAA
jgi:anti-sigma regulatory factor (Ser/Thr protein kinase)